MDTQTKQILSDGDELDAMVKGTGWSIAKKRLVTKIMDLGDILSISEKDPNKLMLEIGSRQMATNVLWEWLRDIEGDVERNKTNQEVFRKFKEEAWIINGE